MILFWNFDNFARIRLATIIWGVFKVANYESEVTISKFKMANPRWRSSTRFFSEILTILLFYSLRNGDARVFEVADDKSQNKKWRIQYGSQLHQFLVKPWQFCAYSLRNGYSGVFEVALRIWSHNLKIWNGGSNMAVKYIIFSETLTILL